MSSFTENLYYKKQIHLLTEQNYRLKKLISEVTQNPTEAGLDSAGKGSYQTGGYAYPGTKDYGLTNAQSPLGYGRPNGNRNPGNRNPGTGGPLFTQGYLPPNIMNFIINLLEELGAEYLGLIGQDGQMNWMNWALQVENNPAFGNSIFTPVIQTMLSQLGTPAVQQFARAFRQWQASQSRR